MCNATQNVPTTVEETAEIAASVSLLSSVSSPNSETIQYDKSQPPTPDGSATPVNFQIIAPGLYRSSYPQSLHFERLSDLELKTVITLVPEPLPLEYANFISSNGIIHHHIPILANKDEAVCSSAETVNEVLKIMLDPANYPMMIHCNKGKHRTGCITACFRKVTGWTLEACVDEYERFSKPKDRWLDKVFIDRFDASVMKPMALEHGFVGGVYRQPVQESTKSSVYTAGTYDTFTSEDSEYVANDYHERAKRENDAVLESSRLWSYK